MRSSALLVEPTWANVPDYHQTLGPEIGELLHAAGFGPDPEQQLCLDAMCGIDKRGDLTAFEVCVIGSRQNLKTGLFKMAAIGKAFLMGRSLFVWSAHEFSTTQEAFRDLVILIESNDFLDSRVKRIYRGNGDESIELKNDCRIKFKARTKAGGRGLTGNDVLLDEAFALKPEHMGALLPTLSAVKNPQVTYGSSAGLVDSEVLRGIRDRGRAGSSPRLAYLEWGNERGGCEQSDCAHALDAVGCALDDQAKWQRSNPTMGRRISVDYILGERQALPPLEFARERLGWWDEPGLTDAIFGEGRWEQCLTSLKPPLTGLTFGIARSVDQAWTSIGIAVATERGTWHVAPVDRRRGSDWVAATVAALHEKRGGQFVIAGSGSASSLITEIKAAGTEPLVASTPELCDACAAMYDRVQEKRVEHRGYPELDEAVRDAERRDISDRWVFSRKNSDVTMLEAVALALWGAVQPEEPEMEPYMAFA